MKKRNEYTNSFNNDRSVKRIFTEWLAKCFGQERTNKRTVYADEGTVVGKAPAESEQDVLMALNDLSEEVIRWLRKQAGANKKRRRRFSEPIHKLMEMRELTLARLEETGFRQIGRLGKIDNELHELPSGQKCPRNTYVAEVERSGYFKDGSVWRRVRVLVTKAKEVAIKREFRTPLTKTDQLRQE